MTFEEAKEIFPKESYVPPENAVGYVYVTFNVDEGKFYIGKQLKNTWNKSYYGGGRNPKIWVKQNLQLEHWPIQWCYSREELNQAEWDWINAYKNNKDIANLIEGGTGGHVGFAKIINKECLQRRSEMFKGEKNPFYNKHHTEETRKIMSQKAKERMSDPENRKKDSETLKEYYRTHDNPFKGKNHTDETKKIISQKAKERMNAPGYIHYNSKPVMCIETGQVFNSASDAHRFFGKKSGHITDVCAGAREKAFGYHWKWVKNDEGE